VDNGAPLQVEVNRDNRGGAQEPAAVHLALAGRGSTARANLLYVAGDKLTWPHVPGRSRTPWRHPQHGAG